MHRTAALRDQFHGRKFICLRAPRRGCPRTSCAPAGLCIAASSRRPTSARGALWVSVSAPCLLRQFSQLRRRSADGSAWVAGFTALVSHRRRRLRRGRTRRASRVRSTRNAGSKLLESGAAGRSARPRRYDGASRHDGASRLLSAKTPIARSSSIRRREQGSNRRGRSCSWPSPRRWR